MYRQKKSIKIWQRLNVLAVFISRLLIQEDWRAILVILAGWIRSQLENLKYWGFKFKIVESNQLFLSDLFVRPK